MERIYVISAVVGGTLFVCQFILGLIGVSHVGGDVGMDHDLGADHDLGGDHDAGHAAQSHGDSWFLGIFSLRAIVAAITAFGLGGMVATRSGYGGGVSAAAALLVGLIAMGVVAAAMRAMLKLRDDGTIRVANAVGLTGTVYLTIPGEKAGFGKVTLDLQNRSSEFSAATFHHELATGTKVVVVDVIAPDTLEVIAAPESPRSA